MALAGDIRFRPETESLSQAGRRPPPEAARSGLDGLVSEGQRGWFGRGWLWRPLPLEARPSMGRSFQNFAAGLSTAEGRPTIGKNIFIYIGWGTVSAV